MNKNKKGMTGDRKLKKKGLKTNNNNKKGKNKVLFVQR